MGEKCIKKKWLFLFACSIFVLTIGMSVNAGTLSKDQDFKQWFVVPEGGHSAVTGTFFYDETYESKSSTLNRFTAHAASCLFITNGATSIPYIGFMGIRYYRNGNNLKTFYPSDFEDMPLIYRPKYNGSFGFVFHTPTTCGKNTSVIGKASYTLYCDDAAMPQVAKVVSMSMKP